MSDGSTPVERLLRELAFAGLDDDALLERLYAGALEEGPIVQYANNGNPRPEVWKPAFEAAFPGVSLDVLQLSASALNDRGLAESGLGEPLADVVATIIPGVALLDTADILASGVAGIAPTGIDPRYVDESHIVVASNPYVIAWNTDLGDGSEVTGWDDLVVPGRPACVVSDGALSWYAWTIGEVGEDGLRSWIDRAERNGGGIRFGRSSTSLVTALAAGEERCAAASSRALRGLERDGAPVAWSVPPGSPSAQSAFSILRETTRPHAAALLVAWGLRAEAAVLYAEHDVFPTNGATADVRPPADEFVPPLDDVLDQGRRAAQLLAELSSGLSG